MHCSLQSHSYLSIAIAGVLEHLCENTTEARIYEAHVSVTTACIVPLHLNKQLITILLSVYLLADIPTDQ